MRLLRGTVSILFILSFITSLTGCMKWDYGEPSDEYDISGDGLFILCEGNFQYGNATLSFYDPETSETYNEVFLRSNGMKLGDVAQSMTMQGGKGWITVNNSHVIFAIDPDTFREIGRIENLPSPRFIHFVSDDKAYVTQLWDNRIVVVNPSRYEITGYIEVPDMPRESGSTEQMVSIGRYVYCTCWSYQNRIIKIDTQTDMVVASLQLGVQPRFIVTDAEDRLWVISDGGYEGSPYGYEPPALYRIDPETLKIEKEFRFRLGSTPTDLRTDGSKNKLYWINDDVWCMDISAGRLPAQPLIESRQTRYYGLTVDPESGDVYVADAIDYQQQGKIYRYSPQIKLIDEFYVGVNPTAFCWK